MAAFQILDCGDDGLPAVPFDRTRVELTAPVVRGRPRLRPPVRTLRLALAGAGAALVGAGLALLTPPVATPPASTVAPPYSSHHAAPPGEATATLSPSVVSDAPARALARVSPPPKIAAPTIASFAGPPVSTPPGSAIDLAPTLVTAPAMVTPPPSLSVLPVARNTTVALTGSGFVSGPSAAGELPPEVVERNAIEQLLARYRRAYDDLDAGAAAAVWPSVDAVALERAFAGIKEQQLAFDRCDLTLAPERATAVCPGSLTFVRRVGGASAEVRRLAWTFALQRARDGWQITRVAAR